MNKWPIGVFASIDAGLGVHLDVADQLEIPTIQLHAPAAETRTDEHAQAFLQRISDLGIELTAVFGGFEGESYADISTVEKTVGLIPKQLREQRLAEMKEIANFARNLKCDVVALHLGFVPHDVDDPGYATIVETTRELCNHCRGNSQALHLETGQETADSLVQFIDDVGADNLHVNFDPANMILYGTGEPLEALRRIGSHVKSVHCKDATWATNPGNEWGREVPLGEGDVNIPKYLELLDEIGYTGPLTIEREIPQEPERQKAEILHARDLLDRCKMQMT